MFRNVMNDLATWYETGADKIAVVRGGKFVGKTWAVADFAMGFFEDQIDFAGYWEKLSPVGCVIAAVFLIFAGCAINLVMTRIFYKRNFSKNAFGASMRKLV